MEYIRERRLRLQDRAGARCSRGKNAGLQTRSWSLGICLCLFAGLQTRPTRKVVDMGLEVRGESDIGVFVFEGTDEAADLMKYDVAIGEFGGERGIEDGREEFGVELRKVFMESFFLEAKWAV